MTLTDPNFKPSSAAPNALDTDYESTLFVKAPAAEVFDALTTLAGLASWWTSVSGSGLRGGRLSFMFNDSPLILRVDEAERPATVRWTVLESAPTPEWVGTAVTFELMPQAEGCELSFRHRGLTPRLECYNDCKNGWDHFLPSLRQYVETGKGNPFGSSADLERREARRLRRQSAAAE
ncbi:MAG: SRPBCC domain-containing protein [Candidatus Dormibacteraeota bacterium]|nr:SRPBCC domain-containing protein [Candidatus Dormibacteraeota bacterium]